MNERPLTSLSDRSWRSINISFGEGGLHSVLDHTGEKQLPCIPNVRTCVRWRRDPFHTIGEKHAVNNKSATRWHSTQFVKTLHTPHNNETMAQDSISFFSSGSERKPSNFTPTRPATTLCFFMFLYYSSLLMMHECLLFCVYFNSLYIIYYCTRRHPPPTGFCSRG